MHDFRENGARDHRRAPATVLVCFTMTLLMGLYAKLPFGVAPGMGLNAFFACSPRSSLIPLTFSVTQGILWGFLLHAALHVVVGRGREVTAAAWGLADVSIALLVIEHVH